MTTTRYEIVAIKGDKRLILGYSARRTKQALWRNTEANIPAILLETGANVDALCTADTIDGIHMDDGLVIRFSGRTELDAKNAR